MACRPLLLIGLLLPPLFAARTTAAAAPSADPRALLTRLNNVSIDPAQIYALRDARLSRDRVQMYFNRGFIGFLGKVDGQVTGAVFAGDGEVLLMPPTAVERQSLAEFTGAAVLEERFNFAYLRFTDQTAQELLAKARRPDPDDPEQPTGFVAGWNQAVRRLNPGQSVRILEDLLGARDRPYFHAQVQGLNLGAFEITVDDRQPEAVSVEAVANVHGSNYVDVWCSFPRAAPAGNLSGPMRVRSYKIDTRIDADNTLEGRATLELESLAGADRMLSFALSHALEVLGVQDDQGRSLPVLSSSPEGAAGERENDWITVVLAAAHPRGDIFRLIFTYRGHVITDAGNGVLYVGAHGSWYPNVGIGKRAPYDLTFHYPARLTLAATGRQVDEHSEGGVTESRWISDGAFPVAGFNLGPYDSRREQLGNVAVEVYATREVEAALAKRYTPPVPMRPLDIHKAAQEDLLLLTRPASPPDPAALLGKVTASAADAVRYFERLFGAFPYPRLAIAQIPGNFGQGWPELVYLPTLSFLLSSQALPGDSAKRNLSEELMVPHEIAHQWWGNRVGWSTYHDQWLSEGLASYAAALDLARGPQGERRFHDLLGEYKRDLVARTAGGETVESGGAIWLGARLSNSKNPGGYDAIVYKKACWVLQMLHGMLADPAGGADDRFFRMLRGFAARYANQDPTTADFARFAAAYLPRDADLDHDRSLDWFFNEWVYGTGIPTYKLVASTRRLGPRKFEVEGRIEQSGVSPRFEMPVPVAAWYGSRRFKARQVLLGRVPTSAAGGRFRFITAQKPSKVAIDEDEILALTR